MYKQINWHKKEYALPKKYNGKRFLCVFSHRVSIAQYVKPIDEFIEMYGNKLDFNDLKYWAYLNTPEKI